MNKKYKEVPPPQKKRAREIMSVKNFLILHIPTYILIVPQFDLSHVYIIGTSVGINKSQIFYATPGG